MTAITTYVGTAGIIDIIFCVGRMGGKGTLAAGKAAVSRIMAMTLLASGSIAGTAGMGHTVIVGVTVYTVF